MTERYTVLERDKTRCAKCKFIDSNEYTHMNDRMDAGRLGACICEGRRSPNCVWDTDVCDFVRKNGTLGFQSKGKLDFTKE